MKRDPATITMLVAFGTILVLLHFRSATLVTSTMGLAMTVPAACTVSTTSITFPNSATGDVTATGTVSVNCAGGTTYDLAIDAGLSFSGSRRRLKHATQFDYLEYQLFQDAVMSTEWGDSGFANTYPAGSTLARTGLGIAEDQTVYAKVLPFSGKSAGDYSDTVTISVHF